MKLEGLRGIEVHFEMGIRVRSKEIRPPQRSGWVGLVSVCVGWRWLVGGARTHSCEAPEEGFFETTAIAVNIHCLDETCAAV